MTTEANGQRNGPLGPDTCFRVNAPLVASQTIDGEAVLIHFETGCYYSAGRMGAEILSLAEQKKPVRQIAGVLAARYAGAPEAIEEAVTGFVVSLYGEGLVVTESGVREGGGDSVGSGTVGAGTKAPFEPPVLQKFTDLEDLLLLDPIHDADEAGWPVAKPESPEAQA